MIVNERATDRARPTFRLSLLLARAATFIKLYLDPLPRGIRRGIPSVNAGSTILRRGEFLPFWRRARIPKSASEKPEEKSPHIPADRGSFRVALWRSVFCRNS